MDFLSLYSELFNQKLSALISEQQSSHQLYAPINYTLGLGGKRLRPLLTLMAATSFGSNHDDAMAAALAVEVFHNFTLIHDDVMDDAPLRRGFTTVHQKWDLNAAILSGDAMMILAYKQLEYYTDERFMQLMKVFNQVALAVCEGQQLDINFENQSVVDEEDYILMIQQKTAVLLAAALQMGAIVAGADSHNQQGIYTFGLELGLAFQLQDDYLDAFGNPETFGKQVGGDIIENKKTYLYLKAMEALQDGKLERLRELFTQEGLASEDKIEEVKGLYRESMADEALKDKIDQHTQKALRALDNTSLSSSKKEQFRKFALWLMTRKS